jgi:hypothetical protein
VQEHAQTVKMLGDLEDRLRAFTPQTEVQRAARTSALQLAGDLKRTSRLLMVQESSQTPRSFLTVVVFWLSLLFLSFAIFAPLNATVLAAIIAGAFSVSMAVNLIFDMDHPFEGFIRVSPAPMQQAFEKMKP